jgi:hypothetical protein
MQGAMAFSRHIVCPQIPIREKRNVSLNWRRLPWVTINNCMGPAQFCWPVLLSYR